MEPSDRELEALLSQWSAGDREALAKATQLVHRELRDLARRQLRREPRTATLTPTELVNEAYVKLAAQNRSEWHNRPQFLAIARTCMQRVLLDHARQRLAVKRPRRDLRVTIHTGVAVTEEVDVSVKALLEALRRLAVLAPHLEEVVSLRWFTGCSNAELVEITGASLATVKRRVTLAEAWLRKELGKPGNSKPIH